MKSGDSFGPHTDCRKPPGMLVIDDVVRAGLFIVECDGCHEVLSVAEKGATGEKLDRRDEAEPSAGWDF